jgi:uncharacterized protein (TIGR00255 family)
MRGGPARRRLESPVNRNKEMPYFKEDKMNSGQIASMTGFAAVNRELNFGNVAIELRAVNHRYLEFQFRLPEELRASEGTMREMIAGTLSRGKVDCRAVFTPAACVDGAILDVDAIDTLDRLQREVRAKFAGAVPLTVADVLRWPGILAAPEFSGEKLREATLNLLADALEEFRLTRLREGDKLKLVLLDRVAAMEAQTSQIAPLIPQLLRAFQEKLSQRLVEALGSADAERLRQEVLLFAAKIDVDEELSRLQTHFAEVRRVLDKGGACGKRLDFLMQELNREANTLGSKSVAIEASKVALELKVLIEQMREQVQNIE